MKQNGLMSAYAKKGYKPTSRKVNEADIPNTSIAASMGTVPTAIW